MDTVTYTFTASRPGTFYYQSATNMDKQLEMGLFDYWDDLHMKPESTMTARDKALLDRIFDGFSRLGACTLLSGDRSGAKAARAGIRVARSSAC